MLDDDCTPGPAPAERLDALRAELAARGLTGFVVPRADEHQGEYVAACARRLAWLTGFTGSAGMAVVLPDQAAVFVDGRYTLQVRSEVDTARFEPVHLIDMPPPRWLGERLKAGDRLGFDPWLHTADQAEAWGAINEAVPHADLEKRALEYSGIIATKSPQAIRMLKFTFNALDEGIAGMQAFAGEATRLAYMTDEAREGRDSFLERRAPDWSGFPYYA